MEGPVRFVGAIAAHVSSPTSRLLGLAKHLGIILILEKIYELSRGVVPREDNVALQNGLTVVHLEKTLHIFTEWRVQAVVLRPLQWQFGPLVLDRQMIISGVNHFYLYSHFVGTLVFLGWLYLFRRRAFPFVRDTLIVTSGLALVVYILFPMMPPRLMGARMLVPHHYRILDTLAPVLNYKLQAAQIGYNPYAAMPSLHFAWALILGCSLVFLGRHIVVRTVGVLYPFMMLATILISANHLLLDAVGSVIVVCIAVGVAALIDRRYRRPSLPLTLSDENRAVGATLGERKTGQA